MTIQEVRTALANRTTTATSLAEQHYAKIAAEDGPNGKGINSFLALSRDRAMAQAAKIDALAAKGDPLPPLAGVPVGIKDVLTMTGSPATAGSLILKGYMPPYDATVVTHLESAGAVLLGKLNCDEFAMGSSNENSAYGPVRNPRALDRVPGGSSGGSAAAVAAGFAVASLGSDTGGSIRQPAAFCGVVGVLPTYGRVSRFGLIAFASSLDRVGPFATNVHDAATMLGVLRRAGCEGRNQLRPACWRLCRRAGKACERPAHRRSRRVLRRRAGPGDSRGHRKARWTHCAPRAARSKRSRCRTPSTRFPPTT